MTIQKRMIMMVKVLKPEQSWEPWETSILCKAKVPEIGEDLELYSLQEEGVKILTTPEISYKELHINNVIGLTIAGTKYFLKAF